MSRVTTKNSGNIYNQKQQKKKPHSKMVGLNSSVLVITLNINGLNTPSWRLNHQTCIKHTHTHNCMLFIRDTL